ncbi:hypothetical protein F0M18_10850 [Pseudohalioglobus sediminis]|uniref:Uncharacterized protein n=1 Tax=Pseudohalioglobus sediminis TaxID=2606449 RepID=A0A5B0WYA2_9GAMM|nr:DUF6498-containing protein [Pseudohalioglobus sediminis]KAA1192010.1 hypothetical protein F0M18_10850 [Pseudohalioglobus sediminis]
MIGPGKGLRPQFYFGARSRSDSYPYEEAFAFKRHWGAILALAVFDIVFLIPAILTFREASELWQQLDGLFNLVAALFITFWLVGWSLAPLTLTALLLLLLFGRETIRARPGELAIDLGLPLLGLRARYRAETIRNLRIEVAESKSARSWRGSHAVFDYGEHQIAFGVNLVQEGLTQIQERIETFTGVRLRRGEARADELSQASVTQAPPASRAAQLVPAAPVADPVTLASPSSLLLIAANIVPLLGAVFWNWDLGLVMLLYWAESAVIGFFNVCRMIVIGKWQALGAAPFFIAHFGGFMAVHFLFLYTFFLGGLTDESSGNPQLQEVAGLFIGLWPALLALFISHGYSFLHNFLGRREYVGRSIRQQMGEPYSRIIFMHLVIIFGGALSMILGQTAPVIMGVIVLKTWIDLRSHLKQHTEDTADATGGSPPAAT